MMLHWLFIILRLMMMIQRSMVLYPVILIISQEHLMKMAALG